MGLFSLFGGNSQGTVLDREKSDENKKRMREIFDAKVENDSQYHIVYAYSEDIRGANFAVHAPFPIDTEALFSGIEKVI